MAIARQNCYSPAELLMGRKLRTTLPHASKQLEPGLPNTLRLREKERKMRDRMKRNFDKRHGARNLKPLNPGDTVWIPEHKAGGTVVRESDIRSYVVQTDNGTYRRNRRDLILMPEETGTQSNGENDTREIDPPADTGTSPSTSTNSGMKTRSGRVSKPPTRLYAKLDNAD